jgi:glycosyltransferase involved in cell wall biosynthesis
MKILYLHQYYALPKNSTMTITGTRSYEFARRFAAAGHEVHVVTSQTQPERNGRGGWFETDEDGVHVHWLRVPYSNRMGFGARAWAFSKFALAARSRAARIGGDVVFATSTPLTIAIPGIHAARRNRIPLVFEVRDLWPEAPRQIGALTNPLLLWAARRLELSAYRHSRFVIALSPGMRDGVIAAGVPRDRVFMVPNASDLKLFHPSCDGSAHRARLALGDRLALIYFGTMGPANGLDYLLNGAAELKRRGEKRAVIVLHGDGKMRPHLERRKDQEGLDNVVFSNPLPDKSKLAEIVAACDIGLTIYKNLPILYTCSPNKMFDTLAAGKPVLTNMPGWLGDLVTQNHCGVFAEPDNSGHFADCVQELIMKRSQLPEMGRRARMLAEQEFDRDKLAAQVLKVLECAVRVTLPKK